MKLGFMNRRSVKLRIDGIDRKIAPRVGKISGAQMR